MANLTPWLSTLRCIVPVASSGQILSQYVLVLASMQTPCSHLLRVTHECIVCSLRSSFLNVGMQLICLKDLESEAPVLNSEFCIRGLEGRLTFFFGHLLAEIFGAISLCSFWKGRLKENHLSAVTGRGGRSKSWAIHRFPFYPRLYRKLVGSKSASLFPEPKKIPLLLMMKSTHYTGFIPILSWLSSMNLKHP